MRRTEESADDASEGEALEDDECAAQLVTEGRGRKGTESPQKRRYITNITQLVARKHPKPPSVFVRPLLSACGVQLRLLTREAAESARCSARVARGQSRSFGIGRAGGAGEGLRTPHWGPRALELPKRRAFAKRERRQAGRRPVRRGAGRGAGRPAPRRRRLGRDVRRPAVRGLLGSPAAGIVSFSLSFSNGRRDRFFLSFLLKWQKESLLSFFPSQTRCSPTPAVRGPLGRLARMLI